MHIASFSTLKLAKKRKGQSCRRFFHLGGVAEPPEEVPLPPVVAPHLLPAPLPPVLIVPPIMASYTATWNFNNEFKARRGGYSMDSLMRLYSVASSTHYGYETEKTAILRHLKEFNENLITPLCTRDNRIKDDIIFVEATDPDLVEILVRLQNTASARNKFGFTDETAPQRTGGTSTPGGGFASPSTPMSERSVSGLNDSSQAFKVAVQDLATFLNNDRHFKDRERYERENGLVWV